MWVKIPILLAGSGCVTQVGHWPWYWMPVCMQLSYLYFHWFMGSLHSSNPLSWSAARNLNNYRDTTRLSSPYHWILQCSLALSPDACGDSSPSLQLAWNNGTSRHSTSSRHHPEHDNTRSNRFWALYALPTIHQVVTNITILWCTCYCIPIIHPFLKRFLIFQGCTSAHTVFPRDPRITYHM